MRALVGVVALISWVGSAHAEPDSLSNLLGPREIAVGEAMRGGATGASSIGLNPAGLPLNRELVFEGGYGYRGDDSASLIGVSACDSTNIAPGCFFYDYAGASPEMGGVTGSRRTHVAGMALSKLVVPRVFVGATVKYFDHESNMMGEADASGFAFDAGLMLRLTDMINLGVSAQNLVTTEDSPQFPRAVGGGFQARPLPMLTLGFDARWRFDDGGRSMRYGGGAELFLSGAGGRTGYPIRVGALHDNGLGSTYLSGGVGLNALKWGIDLAARREVKGGDGMMVIASMRFFGPRLAAPGLGPALD